jgi:hypothetical protein
VDGLTHLSNLMSTGTPMSHSGQTSLLRPNRGATGRWHGIRSDVSAFSSRAGRHLSLHQPVMTARQKDPP